MEITNAGDGFLTETLDISFSSVDIGRATAVGQDHQTRGAGRL
jgi:hypothetical protein